MPRELRINDIVGRMVYDVEGRKVGRIEEMLAVIELEEHGNDYVVVEYHLGAYGLLEAFTELGNADTPALRVALRAWVAFTEDTLLELIVDRHVDDEAVVEFLEQTLDGVVAAAARARF